MIGGRALLVNANMIWVKFEDWPVAEFARIPMHSRNSGEFRYDHRNLSKDSGGRRWSADDVSHFTELLGKEVAGLDGLG